MPDRRCNCGEPDCPICQAPAHMPWTPKAGKTPQPPPEAMSPMQKFIWEMQESQLAHYSKMAQARRYVLVLLMTGLGSMIGSAITLYILN